MYVLTTRSSLLNKRHLDSKDFSPFSVIWSLDSSSPFVDKVGNKTAAYKPSSFTTRPSGAEDRGGERNTTSRRAHSSSLYCSKSSSSSSGCLRLVPERMCTYYTCTCTCT